jgi:hypothetical protein
MSMSPSVAIKLIRIMLCTLSHSCATLVLLGCLTNQLPNITYYVRPDQLLAYQLSKKSNLVLVSSMVKLVIGRNYICYSKISPKTLLNSLDKVFKLMLILTESPILRF